MINRGYEGNRSLRRLQRVTTSLQAKIRRIFNGDWNALEDENILIFAGNGKEEFAYVEFKYLKHEISAEADNGTITVYEFDYYGGGFWSNEAREIGKFEF